MTGGPVIWLLVFIALAAGMLLPVQAGVNAQLRTFVGHPIAAATIQFLVATAALILILILMRAPMPQSSRLSSAPWWVWVGGLCGANYVVIAIFLAPRLGATTLLAVSVFGQTIVSLFLDHYGLIGFPEHPVSVWRIVGAVLLLAGMALVQRF
jgi:bacterial/archaeal transporter family-2 protein